MSGYFLVARNISEQEPFNEKPFCKLAAWIDMIGLANWEDKDWNGEAIPRGSFITSQAKLAERWGWPRGKVRWYLADLENRQRISQQSTQAATKITLINYARYQALDKPSRTRNTQSTTKTTTSGATTTKEVQYTNTLKKEYVPSIFLSEKFYDNLPFQINKHLSDIGITPIILKEINVVDTRKELLDLFAAKKQNGYKCKDDEGAIRSWVFKALGTYLTDKLNDRRKNTRGQQFEPSVNRPKPPPPTKLPTPQVSPQAEAQFSASIRELFPNIGAIK